MDKGTTMLGRVLDGRYRIDSVLGSGGMGDVFQGTQLAVGRQVAIKLIQRGSGVPETLESRFFREAQIMSGLSHPNIVQLYDFGSTEDNLVYLVMELVDGIPAMELLRGKRRITPELAVEVGAQLASALIDAHAAHVIHRDLKPGNLMFSIGADGRLRLKVLDFGIAYPHQAEVRLTKSGLMCGTPAYLSPEQARGAEQTSAVDIYGAGVVLFELLTGQLPFSGETMTLMFRHVQEPPPPLVEFVNSGVFPAALVELVHAMLAKRPAERPTAKELASRFERMMGPRLSFDRTLDNPFEHFRLSALEPNRAAVESRKGKAAAQTFETSTPFAEASDEVKGAWSAFLDASDGLDDGNHPKSIDPNVENEAWGFEHGFTASEPAPIRSPSRTSELDQEGEFSFEAAKAFKTADYDAVPPRVDEPFPSRTAAPQVPASQPAPSPATESFANLKATDLTLDRPELPAEEKPAVIEVGESIPAIVWYALAFFVGVIVVGAGLYLIQAQRFAPEQDTMTREELEEYWKERENDESEDELPAKSRSKPVTKAKPAPKPAPKKDEVIDIWDDQAGETRDFKIERKR